MMVRKSSSFLTAKNGSETLDTVFVAHDLFKGTVVDFDHTGMSFTFESFFLFSLYFRGEKYQDSWRLKNVNKSSAL